MPMRTFLNNIKQACYRTDRFSVFVFLLCKTAYSHAVDFLIALKSTSNNNGTTVCNVLVVLLHIADCNLHCPLRTLFMFSLPRGKETQIFRASKNIRVNCMVQSPFWKLTGLQLVKKFPAFHGTRRFITALTSVRHLSLSWASPIQSIYPNPTS